MSCAAALPGAAQPSCVAAFQGAAQPLCHLPLMAGARFELALSASLALRLLPVGLPGQWPRWDLNPHCRRSEHRDSCQLVYVASIYVFVERVLMGNAGIEPVEDPPSYFTSRDLQSR